MRQPWQDPITACYRQYSLDGIVYDEAGNPIRRGEEALTGDFLLVYANDYDLHGDYAVYTPE